MCVSVGLRHPLPVSVVVCPKKHRHTAEPQTARPRMPNPKNIVVSCNVTVISPHGSQPLPNSFFPSHRVSRCVPADHRVYPFTPRTAPRISLFVSLFLLPLSSSLLQAKPPVAAPPRPPPPSVAPPSTAAGHHHLPNQRHHQLFPLPQHAAANTPFPLSLSACTPRPRRAAAALRPSTTSTNSFLPRYAPTPPATPCHQQEAKPPLMASSTVPPASTTQGSPNRWEPVWYDRFPTKPPRTGMECDPLVALPLFPFIPASLPSSTTCAPTPMALPPLLWSIWPEELGGDYCEPEPEDPYREQELPEGFNDDNRRRFIFLCSPTMDRRAQVFFGVNQLFEDSGNPLPRHNPHIGNSSPSVLDIIASRNKKSAKSTRSSKQQGTSSSKQPKKKAQDTSSSMTSQEDIKPSESSAVVVSAPDAACGVELGLDPVWVALWFITRRRQNGVAGDGGGTGGWGNDGAGMGGGAGDGGGVGSADSLLLDKVEERNGGVGGRVKYHGSPPGDLAPSLRLTSRVDARKCGAPSTHCKLGAKGPDAESRRMSERGTATGIKGVGIGPATVLIRLPIDEKGQRGGGGGEPEAHPWPQLGGSKGKKRRRAVEEDPKALASLSVKKDLEQQQQQHEGTKMLQTHVSPQQDRQALWFGSLI
nr:unnamed protein product [Digitaria exilis]